MTSDLTADPLEILTRTPVAQTYFAPVYDWSEFNAGFNLMVDAVIAGHDLVQTLALAGAVDAARGARCTDMRGGAMHALLSCLDVLMQGDKKRFAVSAPEQWPALGCAVLEATGVRRRALLLATPPESAAAVLNMVLLAARAAGPYLRHGKPAARAAAAAQQPMEVNVALQLPPGPLPMAIVSQPATRAVQTVERDAADEITRTVTETTPVPAG